MLSPTPKHMSSARSAILFPPPHRRPVPRAAKPTGGLLQSAWASGPGRGRQLTQARRCARGGNTDGLTFSEVSGAKRRHTFLERPAKDLGTGGIKKTRLFLETKSFVG